MADVSKIKLLDNTEYDIKDTTARTHANNHGQAFASGLYKITTNAEGHVTAATAVAKADITGLGIPGSDTNTHRPIKVNGTQNLGDNTTALNLKNGTNVTITANSGDVTISATDTTYESKTAALDGTDVSLVTTGEKYTWNETVERVNDLETEVDNKAPVIVETASGDIASFDDGADGMPIKSMTVQIEPVQDLHGYDSPWPVGGGKNKFQTTAITQTVNGVTFTVNDDGSVTITGEAGSGGVSNYVFGAVELPAGSYKANGFADGASNAARIVVYNVTSSASIGVVYGGSDISFTLDTSATIRMYPIIPNNAPGSGVTYKMYPMIRLSTESDASYAPYSNICPITGHTAVTVTRTGKNLFDLNEYTAAGATVYTEGEYPDSYTGNKHAFYRLHGLRGPNSPGLIGRKPFGQLTISFYNYSTGNTRVYFHYTDEEAWVNHSGNISTVGLKSYTSDATKVCDGVTLDTNQGNTATFWLGQLQVEIGSTATEYESPLTQTYPITFPSEAGTVYGGELTVNEDGSGSLVVETQKITITSFTSTFGATSNGYAVYRTVSGGNHRAPIGKEYLMASNEFTYSANGYSTMNLYEYGGTSGVNETFSFILPSSISSLSEANAWAAANPIEFTYSLATPLTYQLTTAQVYTLLGLNSIWADTGNVNVTYCADTKAYVDRTADIYYVEGSTSDAAGVWTGSVNGLTSYYNGLTVIYVTKVAGKSGYVTLNLNNLGEIQCYNTDKGAIAAITTHYPAGTPILFTYLDNKFVTNDYSRANDNTTVIHQLYHGAGNYVAHSVVYRYQMLFHVDNNTLTPLNNVSNGYKQTNMTMLTGVQFNPFDEILYYSSTTTVSQNGFFGYNTALYTTATCDLRYSFNLTSSANLMTARQLVYLKVSPQTDGLVKLATDNVPITTTLPIIDDGFWYIMLGRCGDNGYTISLYPNHPVFRYDATEAGLVRVLPQDAVATHENAGLMSAADKQILDSFYYNNYGLATCGQYTVTIPANTLSYTLNADSITASTWIVATSLQKDGFRTTYVNWETGAGYVTFTLGKTLSSALNITFFVVDHYIPSLEYYGGST